MADAHTLQTAQRLHPTTLVQRFLRTLPALIFLLFFQTADASVWISVGLAVAYGLIALPLIVLRYLRFRYWITPQEIVIQRGVLNRQNRSIPIERIQNIAIEQSLLPRLLGTAKVTLETAGSTATEGVLEYVAEPTARDIRRVVRTYQRQHVPESPPDALTAEDAASAPAADEDEMASATLLHEMPLGRVMLSGLFRFSLLYIAVAFSALEYLNLDPEEIVREFTRGPLKPLADFVYASPFLAAVSTIVVAAVLAWATGLVINLNRYYGFRLWLEEEDKLHKRHGLLTVSQRTIPLGKVQAVILRSNPLMRLFGWYRVELQTMGIDVREQGHQVALPFVRLREVREQLAPHLYPLDAPNAFQRVSRLTIRRRFIRYSVALAVATGAVAYFWQPALWALTALPLMLLLAYLQYRYHGYTVQGDLLYVRRGVFRQHLWVLPAERFQVLHVDASIFQRRLDLKSLHVDTAGAAPLSYPEIVDMEAADADGLLDMLYERFQQRYAGAP